MYLEFLGLFGLLTGNILPKRTVFVVYVENLEQILRTNKTDANVIYDWKTDVIINRMQNDKKEIVDLYIPRKCSWTNRLITADDKGAVQFRVAHVNKDGHMIKDTYTYISLSGKLRGRGEADMAVNELVKTVPGINI